MGQRDVSAKERQSWQSILDITPQNMGTHWTELVHYSLQSVHRRIYQQHNKRQRTRSNVTPTPSKRIQYITKKFIHLPPRWVTTYSWIWLVTSVGISLRYSYDVNHHPLTMPSLSRNLQNHNTNSHHFGYFSEVMKTNVKPKFFIHFYHITHLQIAFLAT